MLNIINPIKTYVKEITTLANDPHDRKFKSEQIVDLALTLINSWQFNLLLELPVNFSNYEYLTTSNRILLEQITRVQEDNTKLLLENRELKKAKSDV